MLVRNKVEKSPLKNTALSSKGDNICMFKYPMFSDTTFIIHILEQRLTKNSHPSPAKSATAVSSFIGTQLHSFIFIHIIFIYFGCAGLHCCAGFFSSWGEQGLLSSCGT